MALFVLCELILQTRMHSHPVGLYVWFLVGPFVYFHTSCVQTAKALAKLCKCTDSPDPSLVAYVVSIIISWAGSNILCFPLPDRLCLIKVLTTCIEMYKPVTQLSFSPHYASGLSANLAPVQGQIQKFGLGDWIGCQTGVRFDHFTKNFVKFPKKISCIPDRDFREPDRG